MNLYYFIDILFYILDNIFSSHIHSIHEDYFNVLNKTFFLL